MERLTQERLKELLHYDPATGIFRWLVNKGSVRAGDVAGHVMKSGYVKIRVNGNDYFAHRLAWLYIEGYFPEHEVDHKDGDRANNRWSNLREVSRRCNGQNCVIRSNNISGYPGVCWYKRCRKWCAQIKIDGKTISLGYYPTALEAALARYTSEVWCPDWTCNHRSELVKAIQREWPEFKPTE